MARSAIFTAPGGTVPGLISDLLHRNHVLIAGTSGSGKSTLINSIMHNIMLYTPAEKSVILIDPKRVDLIRFAGIPHCYRHVNNVPDAIETLRDCRRMIDERYKAMEKNRQTLYQGGDVYIIIDELADLMVTARSEIIPLLQSIGQIGRAARFHVIAATQCPLAKIIPTEIKVNFDGIIGLRTRSAQDSRNILGMAGCEELPVYGFCLYDTPKLRDITMFSVPYYTDDMINDRVTYWEGQRPHRKSLLPFRKAAAWLPALI